MKTTVILVTALILTGCVEGDHVTILKPKGIDKTKWRHCTSQVNDLMDSDVANIPVDEFQFPGNEDGHYAKHVHKFGDWVTQEQWQGLVDKLTDTDIHCIKDELLTACGIYVITMQMKTQHGRIIARLDAQSFIDDMRRRHYRMCPWADGDYLDDVGFVSRNLEMRARFADWGLTGVY